MVSYVVCLYHERAYGYMAEPSMRRQQFLYGAEVIIESDPLSLYAAYERGRQRATFPTVVYLHDDVALMDFDASPRIIAEMNRAECGLMGVVGARQGARGAVKLPWWHDDNDLIGGWCGLRDDGNLYWNYGKHGRTPCEPYTGRQRPEVGEVDQLDGIILCDRSGLPWPIREGWHGYDAERCYQVKASRHTVAVGDLLVCHQNHPHEAGHIQRHKERMAEIREDWAA